MFGLHYSGTHFFRFFESTGTYKILGLQHGTRANDVQFKPIAMNPVLRWVKSWTSKISCQCLMSFMYQVCKLFYLSKSQVFTRFIYIQYIYWFPLTVNCKQKKIVIALINFVRGSMPDHLSFHGVPVYGDATAESHLFQMPLLALCILRSKCFLLHVLELRAMSVLPKSTVPG